MTTQYKVRKLSVVKPSFQWINVNLISKPLTYFFHCLFQTSLLLRVPASTFFHVISLFGVGNSLANYNIFLQFWQNLMIHL